MEKKEMERADNSQCSELFDYERTEVILKLEGRFASISSKDTGYEERGVSAEKLKIPTVSVPEAEITKPAISFPKTEPVLLGTIPAVKLKKKTVSIPGSVNAAPKAQAIPAAGTEKIRVTLPQVRSAQVVSFAAAPEKIQPPELPKKKTADTWQRCLSPVSVSRVKVCLDAPVCAKAAVFPERKFSVEMTTAQVPPPAGPWKNAARVVEQIPDTGKWERTKKPVVAEKTAAVAGAKMRKYLERTVSVPVFTGGKDLGLPKITVDMGSIHSFSAPAELTAVAISSLDGIPVPQKPEVDKQVCDILAAFQI